MTDIKCLVLQLNSAFFSWPVVAAECLMHCQIYLLLLSFFCLRLFFSSFGVDDNPSAEILKHLRRWNPRMHPPIHEFQRRKGFPSRVYRWQRGRASNGTIAPRVLLPNTPHHHREESERLLTTLVSGRVRQCR